MRCGISTMSVLWIVSEDVLTSLSITRWLACRQVPLVQYMDTTRCHHSLIVRSWQPKSSRALAELLVSLLRLISWQYTAFS